MADETEETTEVDIFQQALEKAYNGEGHFQNKKVIKDDDGNFQLVDKTEDEILADGLEDEVTLLYNSKISKLEKYLAETDWYAIRKNETGKDIPTDIFEAREQARDDISSMRISLQVLETDTD